MRPWRKLHREFLSSSRIRGVSDAAYRLWTMLISAQDDDGAFAWADEAQLSMLVAGTTQWTIDDRERLAIELEDAGLITRENGFLFLYRGEEFNGHLRKSNKPFYYRTPDQREATGHHLHTASNQQSPAGNQRSTTGNQQFPNGALEEKKRRGDKDKEGEGEAETKEPAAALNKPEQALVESPLLNALTTACIRDFGSVEPGLARVLKKFAELHPKLSINWVEQAFDEAAKNSARSWKYVATVLESWIERGRPGKPTKDKYHGKTGIRSRGTQSPNNPTGGFKPVEGPASRIG